MTRLHLIRHGRATAREANYDQLHDHGVEQSRLLGRWLAEQGARFDAVYVGPLARQLETLRLMREAAGDGASGWPAAQVLDGLAEAPHDVVVKQHMLPRLEGDPELAAKVKAVQEAPDRAARHAAGVRVFDHMVDVWRNGAIEGVETHAAFVERVEEAFQAILARETEGREVMVVTSNGVIGAILERHAGCAPDPGESLLRFPNSSITRLERVGGALRLLDRGTVEHLPDPELITVL